MSKTGFIYKINCKDMSITDFYIGSTMNFNQREIDHKKRATYDIKLTTHLKLYQTIKSNGGWDNWEMNIINICKIDTKKELCEIEQKFMTQLLPTLNNHRAYQTAEQRKEQKHSAYVKAYEIKKLEYIAKSKKWREDNRERYNELAREVYHNKKDGVK
jgi:predicted GIY-YIG superfamily endonuclease